MTRVIEYALVAAAVSTSVVAAVAILAAFRVLLLAMVGQFA